MTENDFETWLAYHRAAFPSLGDWLRKHPETLRFWELPFADVDLAHAKAATDEMASGDLDEPRGYSQHARVIAKRARQIGYGRRQSTVIDGEKTYSCQRCLDEGYFAVVDPVHWRAGRLRPCHVLCICTAGDRKAELRREGPRRQTPRFDARKMFPWDEELTSAEMSGDFRRWLDGGRVTELAGYEPAFADFNGE